MSPLPDPISLAAERAVRYLRRAAEPVHSLELVERVLSTRAPSEAAARRVLEAAFGGDPRLVCASTGWILAPETPRIAESERTTESLEPDRTLLLVHGERPSRKQPFVLRTFAALRLREDQIVGACGGDVIGGRAAGRLRREVLRALDGAVPVIHDPPGALKAIEEWLREPLAAPVSLRRLAEERLGLRAGHDLESLFERLGLHWRQTSDPLEQADALDACLQALRRPGESLHHLRSSRGRGLRPLDWSRFTFDRAFLRELPETPGTYRFYDAQGRLVYVGKSKNLRRRIGSYFRDEVTRRTPRVQALLDLLHDIEYETTGSELEAMLREAELIRGAYPEKNVQRTWTPHQGRAARLRSIFILEPARAPAVLQAYLIREGRLIDRVEIGPRGGGLGRIRRVLDDFFFSSASGPTVVKGPGLDVEIIVRWLAENRDSVVAFDPTDLRTSREVIERLRWFLSHGSPFDSDGMPIFTR